MARSTFPSQKVQNTPAPGHFWKLRCRKSARHCGAKHISKSKCTKHTMYGPLLEVKMSKKCTPLWREAHFQVKMLKKTGGLGPLLEVQMSKKCTQLWREAHFEVKMLKTDGVWATFGCPDVVSRGRRKGLCTLSKVRKKSECFVTFPKTMAGVGHLKRICKDAFSVAGAVQEPCSSEMLGGPGADVLRGVACWSIRSSVFRR